MRIEVVFKVTGEFENVEEAREFAELTMRYFSNRYQGKVAVEEAKVQIPILCTKRG